MFLVKQVIKTYNRKGKVEFSILDLFKGIFLIVIHLFDITFIIVYNNIKGGVKNIKLLL